MEKIARLGFKPEFGVRPMKRVINGKIENLIAEKILQAKIQLGSLLDFDVDKSGQILLNIKKPSK